MTYNGNTFGTLLETIRKTRMMTQKELAEKVGTTQSYINKIENGERMPSDKILFRLADVLVAEELFAAAGRLIPPEFNEKYPPPPIKPKDFFNSIQLPDYLKKIRNNYVTGLRKKLEEQQKLEEKIKFNERWIDNRPQQILNLIEIIKNQPVLLDDKYKNLIDSLFISIEEYINYSYQIIKDLWSLAAISNITGEYNGMVMGLDNVWKEIKIIAKSDLNKFLIEVLEIDEDDIVAVEIISDIIKSRKEKKSKKKPSSE